MARADDQPTHGLSPLETELSQAKKDLAAAEEAIKHLHEHNETLEMLLSQCISAAKAVRDEIEIGIAG